MSEKIKAKRERFLALLKSRYGYTNDKAVDEMERILKQFYRMNRSLGLLRTHSNKNNPSIEQPESGG